MENGEMDEIAGEETEGDVEGARGSGVEPTQMGL